MYENPVGALGLPPCHLLLTPIPDLQTVPLILNVKHKKRYEYQFKKSFNIDVTRPYRTIASPKHSQRRGAKKFRVEPNIYHLFFRF